MCVYEQAPNLCDFFLKLRPAFFVRKTRAMEKSLRLSANKNYKTDLSCVPHAFVFRQACGPAALKENISENASIAFKRINLGRMVCIHVHACWKAYNLMAIEQRFSHSRQKLWSPFFLNFDCTVMGFAFIGIQLEQSLFVNWTWLYLWFHNYLHLLVYHFCCCSMFRHSLSSPWLLYYTIIVALEQGFQQLFFLIHIFVKFLFFICNIS